MCKKCSQAGNETIHNCEECITNYTFLNDSSATANNCYQNCEYNYYFNISGQYICTTSNSCPTNFNILIESKKKCIDDCKNDNEYIYEYNNNCFKECPKNLKIDIEEKKCLESCKENQLDFNNICYNQIPNVVDTIKESNIISTLLDKIEPSTAASTIKESTIISTSLDKIEPTTAADTIKESTIISTTEIITTSIPTIKKTTEYILTTTINKVTERPIQTTTPNTISQVETPNSTMLIQTTEVIIDSKFYSLIVIGYSHFINANKKVSFYIYFTSLNGLFYAKTLRFSAIITSNRILRILEEYEVICESNDEEAKEKISYLCEVQAEIENIKTFKALDDFKFYGKTPTVIYSPFAQAYKDKIQEIGDNFNNLPNSNIYLLNHCKIEKVEKKYFDISGIIIEPKPKFKKTDINLMVFADNKTETIEIELNCRITDIIGDNYILNCERDENINKYNLKNAISFIDDDEILVIIFDDGINSEIIYEENKYHSQNFSKDTGNLSAGGIIAIILAIIAVIAAVIITIKCFKKRNINKYDNTESSDIKIINI